MFLALSANSPFWNGLDTEMASTRTKIFEGLPTAGLPPRVETWADFERYMETLITAGAIESVRDVWWDVRPHPDFGTVELRMCDAMPTLDEVMALAAMAQSLVADLAARFDRGEPLPGCRDWVVKENKWRAARYGLEADLVDDDGCRTPVTDVIDRTGRRAHADGGAARVRRRSWRRPSASSTGVPAMRGAGPSPSPEAPRPTSSTCCWRSSKRVA